MQLLYYLLWPLPQQRAQRAVPQLIAAANVRLPCLLTCGVRTASSRRQWAIFFSADFALEWYPPNLGEEHILILIVYVANF